MPLKKAFWKESLESFLGVIHIKINDEVKLRLFQPFDLKMCLLNRIHFCTTIYFINIELCKIYYAF